MKKRNYILITSLLVGMLGLVSGCTQEASSISNAEGLGDLKKPVNTSYNYLPVGTYDSADTAIVQDINKEEGTITLYNTLAAKTYTLYYDGTTYVSDKYGTNMSMAQLNEGTIVNVNFFKATKQLVDIQVSPDAWTYENVSKYDLGGINSTATIGDRTYALSEGVQVFSQGQQADIMNIISGDTITVSGLGYDIYSIKVESGHGYIRLNNDENLVGGWVEIGNELITQVTEENMLLAVPEGLYSVRMYNHDSNITQEVYVERNTEVILDCSEITAPVDMYGRIIFHVTPEHASLLLDGEYKNINDVIKTEYGIHQIEISASGYDTFSRYINVGTELAEITINLDESREYVSDDTSHSIWDDILNSTSANATGANATSGNKTSGNKTSGNKTSSNTTSGNKPVTTYTKNKVYINYPDSVEVYVDGIYKGLTPVAFAKTTGSHTVILKKDGYVTRSYTIYLYDDGDDISISFSELEKIEPVKENIKENTSHSGNETNNTTTPTSSESTGKDDTGKIDDKGDDKSSDTESGITEDTRSDEDTSSGQGKDNSDESEGGSDESPQEEKLSDNLDS